MNAPQTIQYPSVGLVLHEFLSSSVHQCFSNMQLGRTNMSPVNHTQPSPEGNLLEFTKSTLQWLEKALKSLRSRLTLFVCSCGRPGASPSAGHSENCRFNDFISESASLFTLRCFLHVFGLWEKRINKAQLCYVVEIVLIIQVEGCLFVHRTITHCGNWSQNPAVPLHWLTSIFAFISTVNSTTCNTES